MKKSQSSEKSSNKTASTQGDKNYIEFEERVRYSETDQMGVAHNTSYFGWFEIARTEFCRRKSIPYKSIEEQGYYLVVVEAFCKYKKPLRYDDNFFIRVYLKEIAPKKLVFTYELFEKDRKKKVASGHTVHIVTNARSKVCALPPDIVNKIKS